MPKIKDGWRTTVTFSLNPTVELWEIEVVPPGMDGGGPNNTTTMRNDVWRTKAPKNLIDTTAGSINAALASGTRDDLEDMINKNQQITITYPDGATDVFWGWIDKAEAAGFSEGSMPVMDVTFEISNTDNSDNEVGPVFTSA